MTYKAFFLIIKFKIDDDDKTQELNELKLNSQPLFYLPHFLSILINLDHISWKRFLFAGGWQLLITLPNQSILREVQYIRLC